MAAQRRIAWGRQMNYRLAEQRRALRVKEFCDLYALSRSTAYRMIADNRLPSVRVAGRRLIPVDAAERLLNPEGGQ